MSSSPIPAPPPDASATQRGLISTGTQTIAGAKTLTGNLTAPSYRSASAVSLVSTQADSGTAVAVTVDTTSTWVNVNALIASFRMNGVEKAYIYKDGAISSAASIYATAFRPSSGSNGLALVGQIVGGEPGTYVKIAAYPTLVDDDSKIVSFGDSYAGTGAGYVELAYIDLYGSFFTEGEVEAQGNILGSNLSGDNHGDVDLASIGSSPAAAGASMSGQTLQLQPASASFGGVLTAGTQTIAGAKSFVDIIEVMAGLTTPDAQGSNPATPLLILPGDGISTGTFGTGGGDLEFTGGAGGVGFGPVGFGGPGGSAQLIGGLGGDASGGGAGGAGGGFSFYGGTGGIALGSAGGSGGPVSVNAGGGGNAQTGQLPGVGGQIYFQGGSGGVGDIGAVGGAGGDVTFLSGFAGFAGGGGVETAPAGIMRIDSGDGYASGAALVKIGDVYATAITIGRTGKTVTFPGTITANNYTGTSSGTNTGDVTLAAVGAVPNANGASIASQVLTLQPASLTLPGILTAGTQTIGGSKSFGNLISLGDVQVPSGGALYLNGTTGGSTGYIAYTSASVYANSITPDGASAKAFTLNSNVTLANAGAKLLSISNNSVERAYVLANGNIYGSNIVADVGRLISRNANGGISIGTSGTAYLNVPEGSNDFNFGSADISIDVNCTFSAACLISSTRASGNDAVKILDGARLNLSTADASAYLYRSAANTIRTPGALTVDGAFTTGTIHTDVNGLWVDTGRFLSRNATGGFSFGSAGTAYMDMPAGTANINFVSATLSFDVGSTISMLRTSGLDAIKLIDGARFNFSTADSLAYLYRSASQTIRTPGNFTVDNDFSTGVNGDILGGRLVSSAAATGTNSFKSLDGGRWNFSTADASAYLYRSAANIIRTPGAITVDGAITCGAASLDASSGVAVPSHNGALRTGMLKVVIPYTAFSDPTDTHSCVVADVPAKTRIKSIIIDVTTAFNIPAPATDMLLAVGYTGDLTGLLETTDVDSTKTIGLVDADMAPGLLRAAAVQGGLILSWTASKQIILSLFAETGGALTGLTQGSLTVYITYEVLG